MRRSSRPQRAAAHCLARAGLLRAECWRTFHALPLACRVAPNASPRPGLILMPQVRTEGDFSLSVDSSDQVSRFFSAQHLCCQPDAAACSLLVALDSQMRSAFHAPALLMCVVICGCLYSCVQCRRLACTAVRSAGAWRVQLCAVPAPGVYSCVQCRRLACTAVRSAGAWLVQPCAVPAPGLYSRAQCRHLHTCLVRLKGIQPTVALARICCRCGCWARARSLGTARPPRRRVPAGILGVADWDAVSMQEMQRCRPLLCACRCGH